MMGASWVERSLYPFEPHWFDAERWRMHYVDVGEGQPVVFVHGSPGWSFQYREMIKALQISNRCIAPDNLGFGLSDKPNTVTYRPDKHAELFESFVGALGLKDISLVVHGLGGPIGLSYAIRHPDNVRRVVLMNSWLWPLKGNEKVEKLSRFANGRLGRYLFLKQNYAVRAMLPLMLKDRTTFTKAVRKHYTMPFADPNHRTAPYDCCRALLGSSDWLQGLWNQKEALSGIPALILWGMLDTQFGSSALTKWEGVFKEPEVHRLAHTGHFVPEEHGADVAAFVDPFLKDMSHWTNTGVVL